MNHLKRVLFFIILGAWSSFSLYASKSSDQKTERENVEDPLETAISLSNESEVKKLLKEKGVLEPEDKKRYCTAASIILEERKKSVVFFKDRRDKVHLGIGTIVTLLGGVCTFQRALETYDAFNPVVKEKQRSLTPLMGGALLGGLDFLLGAKGLLFQGGKHLWSWAQPEESIKKNDHRQEALKKAGLVTALAGSLLVTTGAFYYAVKGMLCSSAKELLVEALKIQKRVSNAPAYICNIVIKNVDATPGLDDGYRILIDSEIPQQLQQEKAFGIGWFRELLPSRPLEEWFLVNKTAYESFRARYRAELSKNHERLIFLKKIALKNKVTLLYRNNFNAAQVLKENILSL
ncbi:DUF488 family protein [Candidatus Dependentiae bacterium]|nr:DUF488 family protein [Candidatus Dependentiae bacterium]